MRKIYAAALQMVSGIGSARLKALLSFFGSAELVWQASQCDLFLCNCLDEITYNKLLIHRQNIDIYKLAGEWEKRGIHLCDLQDPEYPPLLLHTFNPPHSAIWASNLLFSAG